MRIFLDRRLYLLDLVALTKKMAWFIGLTDYSGVKQVEMACITGLNWDFKAPLVMRGCRNA